MEEDEEEEIEEPSVDDIGFAASATDQCSRIKHETMIVDSGATSHFATDTIALAPTGIASTKQVFLPDGSSIQGSTKAKLPFATLPDKAREVDVLPQLQKSLLSVGKLADKGYTTVFHPRNQGVTVHEEGSLVILKKKPAEIQGWRAEMGLWEMGITNSKNIQAKEENINNVYSLPSIPNAIKYLHAAAGFPPKSTWLAAIKAGNFITWPGLTVKTVGKKFPESDEMTKGHMKLQRMNVRSTKTVDVMDENENSPTPTPKQKKRRHPHLHLQCS